MSEQPARGWSITSSEWNGTQGRGCEVEPTMSTRRARLVTDSADPNEITIDMSTVMMLSEWVPVRFGHRDHAEHKPALALAERNCQRRTARRTATVRRAA